MVSGVFQLPRVGCSTCHDWSTRTGCLPLGYTGFYPVDQVQDIVPTYSQVVERHENRPSIFNNCYSWLCLWRQSETIVSLELTWASALRLSIMGTCSFNVSRNVWMWKSTGWVNIRAKDIYLGSSSTVFPKAAVRWVSIRSTWATKPTCACTPRDLVVLHWDRLRLTVLFPYTVQYRDRCTSRTEFIAQVSFLLITTIACCRPRRWFLVRVIDLK